MSEKEYLTMQLKTKIETAITVLKDATEYNRFGIINDREITLVTKKLYKFRNQLRKEIKIDIENN